jgi:ATP-dependent exoDNAse (exonuclease V) beta subunit
VVNVQALVMNDAVDPLVAQDTAARAQALDVTRSWLVRAPAGSGKTELLIQRFLALLAHVERPEAIVATTFTRKAAAEMRERVVAALHDAERAASTATPARPSQDSASQVAESEHHALTRRLARAALANDEQRGWRLLEQPARLRIVTIDALAAALARQAPLAAGLGALPAFVDDATTLYREAARRALANATASDPHWQTFLAWLDNDAETATRLIGLMLAARDRWPARLFAEDPEALRRDVEAVLAQEARTALATLAARLPRALVETLPVHARVAATTFASAREPPGHAAAVISVAATGCLPAADDRDAWCALAGWLLTRDGAFRAGVTVRDGFPANGSGAKAQERARQKADFVQWLRHAAATPGLADAWHRLRSLPPARFASDAWEFVLATMQVLQAASSALVDVFGLRAQADFTEATLRALIALGTDDDPTDLLLAIDYRLSHLLIDEFQDTSRAQLALIDRLTAAWAHGDGRTLFAVGDPMQSIYRFRQAEVRLFLEAQQRESVGGVPVGVVELACNFRSQRAIVDWVNTIFARVLPVVSDTTRGEAAFSAAHADAARVVDDAPTLDLALSRDDEAERVVARIREARAAGLANIAVLVRARYHAQALLPALRATGIEFSAVDLEGLHDRLVTRDLLSLARALAQPADRVAWLAILRAPWCGLALADLLVIAEASIGTTILDTSGDASVIARLSPSAAARVARLRTALAPSLQARGHAGFALRVRAAWLALGGPACTPSALDRAGADRVFALLAEHEHGGDLPDHDAFVALASQLFADPGATPANAVQVMTLHRAKGLQFDAVILPGLDLPSGSGEPPLLRWKVREHDGEPTLVLAPMRARAGVRAEQDPVYAWLNELDIAEEAAELGRLLYVGATRARARLHLTAVATATVDAPGWKRPARGSALERLWDALGPRAGSESTGLTSGAPVPDDEQSMPTLLPVPAERELVRLPLDWMPPPLPTQLPAPPSVTTRLDGPVFDWADAVAAAVGTVAHRLLAQVAAEGVDAWDERRLQRERDRILVELASEGVEPDRRERAAQRVAAVIARTLADPRGRWLFAREHTDARSEWALAGVDLGRVAHIVVDRSFVADGFRYIVDFKTGSHLGGDPVAFLREEFERYRPQLARYARIASAYEHRPVRIALYHPLVEGGWQEEAFSLDPVAAGTATDPTLR